MSSKAAALYSKDDSGSRHEPIPGSNVQTKDRISLLTHEILVSGLLKEGLEPATAAFRSNLCESLASVAADGGGDWVEMPDLCTFFEYHLGSALINALFGKELLDSDPAFLANLWQYDQEVISLAKRIPRFVCERGYRLRDYLLASIENWHCGQYANTDWSTKMMRDRYCMLSKAAGQDGEALASTDLALVWA